MNSQIRVSRLPLHISFLQYQLSTATSVEKVSFRTPKQNIFYTWCLPQRFCHDQGHQFFQGYSSKEITKEIVKGIAEKSFQKSW